LEGGINFFFFYDPSPDYFVEELRSAIQTSRGDMILACGSESRKISPLRAARRKVVSGLGTEMIDAFFAEYINPADDQEAVFGDGGVLDELQQWKANRWIRFVGASAHDRPLAARLAKDSRVDVLLHRFNMAHRKAAIEVLPAALEAQTPVIAFTATRWGTLLTPHPGWSGQPPRAADCYRYCLARSAIHLVLTAPKSVAELDENLQVFKLPPMNEKTCEYWEQFGRIVYNHGGCLAHDFESRWP
jgi:aryl-alcohol dehydrogenase-like predicted oxidoreductase